jgi:hypothetical protein
MNWLQNKRDEREEQNLKDASYYILAASPYMIILVSIYLAATKQMVAFFVVIGLYCVQQLTLILLTNGLNKKRHDLWSITLLMLFTATLLLSVILYINTKNYYFAYVFASGFIFLVGYLIRVTQLNK